MLNHKHSPLLQLWDFGHAQFEQLNNGVVRWGAQRTSIAAVSHNPACVIDEGSTSSSPANHATPKRHVASESNNTNSLGNIATPASFFEGASGFILENMTVNMVTQERELAVMKLLKRKAIVDAALDSAQRYPPPLCHPGTRETLLETIKIWVSNVNRDHHLLWLHGYAGVGKSAIAQTIAEYCQDKGWLGAAFFFSRPNNRNDPNRVIPSISHQLAITFRSYRQAVTGLLTEDDTILEKTIKIQFDRLIVKLAPYLRFDSSDNSSRPVLIILDGLDECASAAAQREFIDLIAKFALMCKQNSLQIIWMIASRPEWHIINKFDEIAAVSCWRKELSNDTGEAYRDVNQVLRDGFDSIRRKYKDLMPTGTMWPTDSQLYVISSASQGLMLFIRIVLDYIDDDEISNPPAQLDLCLNFFKGGVVPAGVNPLNPLDTLYSGILDTIPSHVLPLTLQLLSIHIHLGEACLSGQSMAGLFFLDQITFHNALRDLRSVARIPSPPHFRDNLYFPHATFTDFLKRSYQSRAHGVSKADAFSAVTKQCVKWYTIVLSGQTNQGELLSKITWVEEKFRRDISRVVTDHFWPLLRSLADENIQRLYDELGDIPFCVVKPHAISGARYSMVYTIYKVGAFETETLSDECLVRIQPTYETDYDLLDKYSALVDHWSMTPFNYQLVSDGHWNFVFLPLDNPAESSYQYVREALWGPGSTYFLMGRGGKSALVVGYMPYMEPDSYLEQTFAKMKVNCYDHLQDPDPWPLRQISDLVALVKAQINNSQQMASSSRFDGVRLVASLVKDWDIYDLPVLLDSIIDIASEHHLQEPIAIQKLCRIVFDSIPTYDRPLVHRILAFLLCCKLEGTSQHVPLAFSSEDLERFLDLEPDVVEDALGLMRSFIFSPYPPFYNSDGEERLSIELLERLKNTIGSTRSFLLDSRYYFGIGEEAWLSNATSYVRWYNSFLSVACNAAPEAGPRHMPCQSPATSYEELYKESIIATIWHALCITAECDAWQVMIELQNLFFCHLHRGESRFSERRVWYWFLALAKRIWEWDRQFDFLINLVRVQPNCSTDHQLLRKWDALGHKYTQAKFPINLLPAISVYPVSLHHDQEKIIPEETHPYHFFLFGHEEKSCLIVMMDPEYTDPLGLSEGTPMTH